VQPSHQGETTAHVSNEPKLQTVSVRKPQSLARELQRPEMGHIRSLKRAIAWARRSTSAWASLTFALSRPKGMDAVR